MKEQSRNKFVFWDIYNVVCKLIIQNASKENASKACAGPISLLGGLLSEVPLEKKVNTKYMEVNVLRNIASMTKRGDDIPTH